MPRMTLAAYIEYMTDSVIAGEPTKNHQRAGQFAFNALARVHPELANTIRATEFDPFYQDNILPQFYQKVAADWGVSRSLCVWCEDTFDPEAADQFCPDNVDFCVHETDEVVEARD